MLLIKYLPKRYDVHNTLIVKIHDLVIFFKVEFIKET